MIFHTSYSSAVSNDNIKVFVKSHFVDVKVWECLTSSFYPSESTTQHTDPAALRQINHGFIKINVK